VELKRKGSEFVGLSPFQQERSPSFTVNDNKALWKDFSSGKGGDIFAFCMEALGMDFPAAVEECAKLAGVSLPGETNGARPPAQSKKSTSPKAQKPEEGPPDNDPPFDPDAYDNSGRSEPGGPVQRTKREITRTYDYTDPGGALIYQVCRVEWQEDGKRKKTFMQRRPGPDGSWIWGLSPGEFLKSRDGDWYQATKERIAKWKGAESRTFPVGAEHGLYRLVELREAGDDDVVYLPEGEKDVNTLIDVMGLVATTNSGGAKNWRADHAEFFRGRDVVILCDNDQPGHDRADLVANTLRGIARRIRVTDFLPLWPEAPKGADVTDWVRDREGNAGELQAFVDTIADWKPAPFESKFGGIPFEKLDEPGEEHEHLIDGILTVGDKSIIGGASRSGKSFLAIDACMSIATGQEFFGHKVMRPGLAVYQAGEGGRGIKKRFRAWRQYHRLDPAARIPVYILPARIDIHSADGDTAKLIEELHGIERMYGMPIVAFFIDTLAKASGVADENSGKDMGIVMGNVDKISEAFPRTHVCLVHHMNAGGTKLRGHTSVHAGVDQVILVTRDEENPRLRTAVLDKQKDEEDGAKIYFELPQITIGYRAIDGNPITSCVPVPTGTDVSFRQSGKPNVERSKMSDTNALIFQSLKDALVEDGIPAPPALKLPRVITTVVHVKHWRSRYKAVASDVDITDNAANQQMKRASEKLLRLKLIGRINPYVWLTGRGSFTKASDIVEPNAEGDTTPEQGEFPET